MLQLLTQGDMHAIESTKDRFSAKVSRTLVVLIRELLDQMVGAPVYADRRGGLAHLNQAFRLPWRTRAALYHQLQWPQLKSRKLAIAVRHALDQSFNRTTAMENATWRVLVLCGVRRHRSRCVQARRHLGCRGT